MLFGQKHMEVAAPLIYQQTFDDGFIMGRGGANILRIDSIGNVLWDRTYISPIGNNCGLSSLKQTSDGGGYFCGV